MNSPLPRIQEILKIICDYLVDDKYALAQLARTSKDFQEPALSVLWYELEGFYALAACLPSHLVKVVETDGEDILTLCQAITSIDLCERLFFYSRRIRVFSEGTDERVDKSIYEALQFATQGEKLLPNVQQLTWDCNNQSFPFIHMFTGPGLIKINLTFSPESLTQLSLLSILQERHPSLTDVELSFAHDKSSWDHRNKAVQLLSSFVYKWSNLERLEIPCLTYATLCEVARLPGLNVLAMKKCKLDAVETPQPVFKGGFPVLIDLTLEDCLNPSDCIEVLKLMDRSPLFYLMVSFRRAETSATYKDVFQTVSEHCKHTALQQIKILDGTSLDNNITTSQRIQMIEFEALKPLFIFRNLRRVLIELTMGILISEPEMVKAMLTSWPCIKQLLIKSRPFTRCPKPLILLQDIIRAASLSPRLEILGLGAFDATSPPEVKRDDTDSINIVATMLHTLYVDDSPIRKPTLVAAALSGVFPSLTVIKTIEDEEKLKKGRNFGEHGAVHKVWKKAEDALQVISAVRSQERLYSQLQKEEKEEKDEIVEDGEMEKGDKDDREGMKEEPDT